MAHVIDAVLQLKDQFSGQLANINQSLSNFQRQARYASNSINKTGKACVKAGKTMTMGITLPIVGVGTAAAKLGMDFEASMSNVSALSGNTGQDLKKLEKAARDAGASTSKSAKDAADALGYMALAGYDNKQMMEALMPVLRLSEAGNLDLARTSDLVTDSLSSLGKSTKDLPVYLDQVAKTAASSNTNIDALMEGLIVCGGTVKNLNVPLDEANTLLGTLANRGIKGSEAGNSFNSILINLTSGAGQAGKAMGKLGLSAFDSKGKFKGVTQTLLELKKKTKNMTEEQRNMYLSMIGGKTQITTLQALLSGVGEEYGELRGKVRDSTGALDKMAKTMQENNKGSITALKSALEELGLKIYDVLKPKIAGAVDVIQNLTNKLNKLTPAQQQTIIKFAMLAAAIGPVIWIIGGIATSISKLGFSFVRLISNVKRAGGILKWLATPGHIVVLVLAAIAVTALLVYKNWDKLSKVFKKVGKELSKFTGIGKKEIKKTEDIFKRFGKNIGKYFTSAFRNMKKVLPQLKGLLKSIGSLFNLLKPIIMPIIKLIAVIFVARIMYAFSMICQIISTAISTISGIMSGLLNVLKGVIDFVVGIFTGNWKRAWEGVKQILSGVIDILKSLWQGLISLLTAPVQAVVDILDSAFHSKVAGIKKAWEGVKTFLSHPIKGTVSLVKNGNLSGVKGKNALGTSYWGGGLSVVGEHGPEIVELPQGSRVYDNKDSRKMASKGGNIAITFGDVHVRKESDIDAIANAIVKKLQIQRLNMA